MTDARRPEAPRASLLVAIGASVGGFAAVQVWLGLGYYSANDPVSFLASIGVAYCFLAAGLAAWRLRPGSRTGPWMVLFAAVVLLAEVNNTELGLPLDLPGRPLTVLVGVPAQWLQYAVGAHLLLAYPTGRLPGRLERRIVGVAFLIAGAGSVLLLLTRVTTPAVCLGPCAPSPVVLVSDPGLYLSVRAALTVAFVGLAAWVLTVLVRRTVRAGPRQRRALGVMAVTSVVTIVLVTTTQVALFLLQLGHSNRATVDVFNIASELVLVIALPLAFLIGLLRERLAFAAVGVLVGRLAHAGLDTVEAELRRTLEDPTLQVAFPTRTAWLDLAGRPMTPPADTRSVLRLGDPPTVVLLHDPALAEHRELLDAAAAAARLALDNARLHAQVQDQLAEVCASRQRIAAAADLERQRLERDLHDGAQQRLLGVGLGLGVLRGRLGSGDHDLVEGLERDLRAAIGDLRELAQGIRPAVLTDHGLGPALAGLSRRAGIRVRVDTQLRERPDPIVEATAYYLVSEALQNVVKHATDAQATVRAHQHPGLLVVEVSDDGPGGARPAAGSGLRGLADRVEAVGGRLEIDSPPGRGTRLRAELPCV